jgi:putative transposase
LLIVKPETVLGWQRAGWRAYWRWRSCRQARGGRPTIRGELQALIGCMAAENRLWGQRRIQAELARLGFQVSARTVAKYMRGCRGRGPTGAWREFLTRHASDMWACDFFCVPTVLFQTLHVFFVIRLANRGILHVEVTRHPAAGWAAQQMLRLGPRATAIFDSRSRQPLWCELRSSRAGRRNTASSHAVQIPSSQYRR